MKIGFIGAGRVGCTLAKLFTAYQIPVTGFYSRSMEHAREAAEFTDTSVYESVESLCLSSDALFLTVSDNQILPVFQEISGKVDLSGKIICHTSGAMSSEIFSTEQDVFCYSIHPMYAVSDRFETYKTIQDAFFTIEYREGAGMLEHLDMLKEVLDTCRLRYTVITSGKKAIYHAASVFSSNYVTALFATSVKLLQECGFRKEEAQSALSGLFLGNAKGTAERGAEAQLTGPIERCDTDTVKKHIKALSENFESVEGLYLALAGATLEVAEHKNQNRDYSDMESLLKEEKGI